MSLARIITDGAIPPARILIYGPHGIGKTTWACSAPAPIVIQTEDGLGRLRVPHFPLCRTYADVLESIGALYTDEHEYKTVVLDSLDWLEQLIWSSLAVPVASGPPSIEGHGYGKGYQYAADRNVAGVR